MTLQPRNRQPQESGHSLLADETDGVLREASHVGGIAAITFKDGKAAPAREIGCNVSARRLHVGGN
ncbi:hypothetical protein D3C87_2135510 [compost metagenome]